MRKIARPSFLFLIAFEILEDKSVTKLHLSKTKLKDEQKDKKLLIYRYMNAQLFNRKILEFLERKTPNICVENFQILLKTSVEKTMETKEKTEPCIMNTPGNIIFQRKKTTKKLITGISSL